ncbi:MAG: FtsX-like permease family protein [bacterium]|nr:FtsX-like permease family protein [bacterium]
MKTKEIKPPKIAEYLLDTLLLKSVDFGALGDYEEQYKRIAVRKGSVSANIWYWIQVIISFPAFLYNSLYGSMIMFKNYLKVAVRNLKRQKAFTLINIAGLAAGMAGFIFFALSGGAKLNSDRFHENADRMYGVVQVLPSETEGEEHDAYTPGPLLPALLDEFPEAEDGLRILPADIVTLTRGDNSFYETGALFVDPNFFTFFDFELVNGNPETVFSQPHSIVLNEKVVLKYFGDEDPIGKVITLGKNVNLTVTGIAKDFPRTTSIRFEFLMPVEAARSITKGLDDWNERKMFSLVLLSDETDMNDVDEKMDRFLTRYSDESPDSPKRLYLFPFLDFRLHSEHIDSMINNSPAVIVFVTIIFGALLLIVVSINFINLSIARYMHRTKEIGLRKVVGARQSQLFGQFIGESILMSLVAIPLAILIYELIQPIITSFLGVISNIGMISNTSNSLLNYPFMLKYLLGAALIVGVFSGFYPALVLSRFQPVDVFGGKTSAARKKGRGRKLMIITQFSFSILFILVAGVLQDQANVLIRSDYGYNRENVAFLRLSGDVRTDYEVIKNELSKNPGILLASACGEVPIIWHKGTDAIPENDEEKTFSINAYGVDYDFLEVMEIEVKAGRSFIRDRGDENAFIINENTAEKLGWKSPLGKQLSIGEKTGTVIGVAEDFVFTDVGFEIPNSVFYIEKEDLNCLVMKYSAGTDFTELKDSMKKSWTSMVPNVPFEANTLEEYFAGYFGVLESVVGIISVVGFVAMIFSVLGLLGISSYLVEKRTKEVGIRKVLGASNLSSMWVLIKEFVVLVVVSYSIAFLLIFFGWKKVLQFGLLFITDIDPSVYIIAALISIGSAIFAVTTQTLKAVRANPVDTLRYE